MAQLKKKIHECIDQLVEKITDMFQKAVDTGEPIDPNSLPKHVSHTYMRLNEIFEEEDDLEDVPKKKLVAPPQLKWYNNPFIMMFLGFVLGMIIGSTLGVLA